MSREKAPQKALFIDLDKAGLSVDLTPVAQLNHQDAQSAVLDVADHATVTHPVTP